MLPNQMHYSLSLQNMVVLPPNFLDSDASIWCVHLAHHAFTTKVPILSYHVRPTPTSNTRGGDFGTHFLLGPRGFALFEIQTFLLAKLIEFTLS